MNMLTARKVSIASVTVTNARNRSVVTIAPNEFPATRFGARRDLADDTPVEFVQVCFCLALLSSYTFVRSSCRLSIDG